MLLSEYLDERSLSPEDVAARLTEHGITLTRGENAGGPITEQTIKRRINSTIPKAWRGALGLDDTSSAEDAPPRARKETAPRRPAEAKITIEDLSGARKRIAGVYKFAGAALAAGSGSEGVAEVWKDQADPIAQLWIEAAEDNPWAAKFVNLMQAGGSVGDLAASHLYLAGATLYVLGAAIPAGDAIFAKYQRHRTVVVQPKPEPAGAEKAGENGHAGEGDAAAAGAVVNGTSEPGA